MHLADMKKVKGMSKTKIFAESFSLPPFVSHSSRQCYCHPRFSVASSVHAISLPLPPPSPSLPPSMQTILLPHLMLYYHPNSHTSLPFSHTLKDTRKFSLPFTHTHPPSLSPPPPNPDNVVVTPNVVLSPQFMYFFCLSVTHMKRHIYLFPSLTHILCPSSSVFLLCLRIVTCGI